MFKIGPFEVKEAHEMTKEELENSIKSLKKEIEETDSILKIRVQCLIDYYEEELVER